MGEFTPGKTDESTKATGKRIICTDRGITNDRMAGSMKESTLTTRKKVTVCIRTQTAAAIKACGKMASSMERASSLVQKASPGKENGKMENGSIGSMRRMSHL